MIQPLDGGRVAAIKVENGQHVKAGDILVELDAADARADETDAASTLDAWKAEAQRRRSAIEAAGAASLRTPTIAWSADIPLANRAREERVLAGDLDKLSSALASLDAQIAQKGIERDRLAATIKSQNELVATLKQRVDMRSSLIPSGAGSKAAVIDARERLEMEATTLASQIGQRDQAAANLKVLAQERRKAIADFIADNDQKLADAQRQVDDFVQRHVKSRLKSGRMALRSPIDGVVMGLSVTTIGQVIGSGEEVMRVVPEGANLEIQAYLANQDIGFVKPGQKAVVKVDAFPFTRYGSIDASVRRVAYDAIPEPDAQATEGDSARGRRDDKMFGGVERTQNLVFPVTLEPMKTSMDVDGATVPLKPGMTVTVEIATGSRRILEYLFSPLVETASKALKER